MAHAVLAERGTRAVGGSSAVLLSASRKHSATVPAPSCKSYREEIPCDPHRFRALFPHLWQAFLRAHFRDAMHAAYSLGVTERAARDWFEGKTGANGAAALYAVAMVPGAMDWIAKEVRKAA